MLKRPVSGWAFLVVIVLIVAAGLATNAVQFRQQAHTKTASHIRDVQVRNIDDSICTILAALGPGSHLPPAFRRAYDRAFADADCSLFKD